MMLSLVWRMTNINGIFYICGSLMRPNRKS